MRGSPPSVRSASAKAHILGDLDFSGANLVNPDGRALSAGRLAVDQDLICGPGFTARGEILLIGAHVGGDLDMGGAALANANGPAVYANRLSVGQSMFCRAGFSASGEVRLLGASVGGRLSLATASLANPGGIALQAERLTVAQDIFFTEGMTAAGEIRLPGARVGRNADFTGCKTPGSGPGFILILTQLQAASLILRPQAAPEEADLTGAAVGKLADEPASWPSQLRLRGSAAEHIVASSARPALANPKEHLRYTSATCAQQVDPPPPSVTAAQCRRCRTELPR